MHQDGCIALTANSYFLILYDDLGRVCPVFDRAAFSAWESSRARVLNAASWPASSAAMSTSSVPTPRAAAPAEMYSPTVARLTPPVGSIFTCGSGPRRARRYLAPPTDEHGKI